MSIGFCFTRGRREFLGPYLTNRPGQGGSRCEFASQRGQNRVSKLSNEFFLLTEHNQYSRTRQEAGNLAAASERARQDGKDSTRN